MSFLQGGKYQLTPGTTWAYLIIVAYNQHESLIDNVDLISRMQRLKNKLLFCMYRTTSFSALSPFSATPRLEQPLIQEKYAPINFLNAFG